LTFLVALFLFVLAPLCASAMTSIKLIWTGSSAGGPLGSSSIVVPNNEVTTLTLDIVLEVDNRGVSVVWTSLEFDRDLGNELNLLGYAEISWSDPESQRSLHRATPGLRTTFESSGAAVGKLYSFEGFHGSGPGPKNTTLTFGRVVFSTNPANLAVDGPDIFSGLFAPDGSGSTDGIFDGVNAGIFPGAVNISSTVSFGTAQVRPMNAPQVPVPLWAAPLVAGLLFGAAHLVRHS